MSKKERWRRKRAIHSARQRAARKGKGWYVEENRKCDEMRRSPMKDNNNNNNNNIQNVNNTIT